ncbi:hypothetical protein [Mucilaginibacter gracilis]|nr:hypothetical protein [Mucilaginibacter gracilis]
MKTLLKQGWLRFRSAVPPTVKKIQIVLGMATASFGAATAITWPGKLLLVGTFCGYAAAVCGGIVLALQFIQQSVTVFETQTEVTVKQTTTEVKSNLKQQ